MNLDSVMQKRSSVGFPAATPLLTMRAQWKVWAWDTHPAGFFFRCFPKRWNFTTRSLLFFTL